MASISRCLAEATSRKFSSSISTAVSRNTASAWAIRPISSRRSRPGIATEVSPAAMPVIAAVMASRGPTTRGTTYRSMIAAAPTDAERGDEQQQQLARPDRLRGPERRGVGGGSGGGDQGGHLVAEPDGEPAAGLERVLGSRGLAQFLPAQLEGAAATAAEGDERLCGLPEVAVPLRASGSRASSRSMWPRAASKRSRSGCSALSSGTPDACSSSPTARLTSARSSSRTCNASTPPPTRPATASLPCEARFSLPMTRSKPASSTSGSIFSRKPAWTPARSATAASLRVLTARRRSTALSSSWSLAVIRPSTSARAASLSRARPVVDRARVRPASSPAFRSRSARARRRSSWPALATSDGAAAAMSAPFSARRSEAAMAGRLSAVMRVTERSMSTKAYQATALATAVSAAAPQKARVSLALMPRARPAGAPLAACASGPGAPTMLAVPWGMAWRILAPARTRQAPSRATGAMLPSARITVRKTRSEPRLSPGP